MELVIETGIAMPKNVRKANGKEAEWVKLFKEIRPTVDIMQPNESTAFNCNKPLKVKRDLTWVLNKYGLHTGKRFVIVATEPKAAVMNADGTIAEAAISGNVRIFCDSVGLETETYEAGNYAEKFTELFAEVAEVVVPEA
jgi:hypothetical protein